MILPDGRRVKDLSPNNYLFKEFDEFNVTLWNPDLFDKTTEREYAMLQIEEFDENEQVITKRTLYVYLKEGNLTQWYYSLKTEDIRELIKLKNNQKITVVTKVKKTVEHSEDWSVM